MALQFFNWSRTANSNATADANINWAEGQAPSSVNDSARAMMASTAGFRDDIAGAIVTSGTSTAYIVGSYQVFDTLAHLNGQMIAFTPHTTCGATVTLNVDSLGAKPLRSAPSVELPAGALVQGTPYLALYNSSDAAFYLHGFFGNVYGIPIGGMIDYTGTTAPNSSFVLPYGQAISRTTYATYFSLVSTGFGTGDGSTTFNVPDLRGRVTVGKDDMGGSAASRVTSAGSSIDGTTLGANGGAQTITLAAAQIPAGVSSTGTLTGTATSSNGNIPALNNTIVDFAPNIGGGGSVHVPGFSGGGGIWSNNSSLTVSASSGSLTTVNGSQTAVNKMPPAIVVTKLLRVI